MNYQDIVNAGLIIFITGVNMICYDVFAPMFNITPDEFLSKVENVYLIVGIGVRIRIFFKERKLSQQEVNYYG